MAASVLVLGQAISACVGLAVYALAKQLGKDWRIGLLAALFVTFATKMPGYYLSWEHPPDRRDDPARGNG